MKKKLFVDMDGTLAEWRKGGNIYEEGYFANLKPLSAVEMVKALVFHADVYILSAVLTDSPFAEKEKREWLRKYLPCIEKDHILFSGYGKESKSDFIRRHFGDINADFVLLDDYGVNLKQWAGTPVKFYNGINGHNKTRYDYSVDVNEDLIGAVKRLRKILS